MFLEVIILKKRPSFAPRICTICGATYQPTGATSRYCPTCKVVQEKKRKREYFMRKFPNSKPKQKCTEPCCVCGGEFSCFFDGKPYCNKHWLRMYNNGTIEPKKRERTNTYDVRGDVTIVTTSNGRTFTVDTADLPAVQRYSWCYSKTGYLVANIRNKVVKLHRYLLEPDASLAVDHINGDPSDNRRCNLRICTFKDNARNIGIQKNNTTGVNGVKKSQSGKYTAQIMVDGKLITIGRFDTLEEAAEARFEAEQKYYGEFAPSSSRNITVTPGVSE